MKFCATETKWSWSKSLPFPTTLDRDAICPLPSLEKSIKIFLVTRSTTILNWFKLGTRGGQFIVAIIPTPSCWCFALWRRFCQNGHKKVEFRLDARRSAMSGMVTDCVSIIFFAIFHCQWIRSYRFRLMQSVSRQEKGTEKNPDEGIIDLL